MPSLKPGEVITWIKLEGPKFPLGEIVISSVKIVGIAVLVALSIGIFLGHLRSRRTGAHGTHGLSLR